MIVARARFSDVADLYAGLGIATPRAEEYRVLVRQLALGPAWSFRPAADAPIAALAGIVHGLEGVTWFRSGAGSERAMPGLVRAFRVLLAAEAKATGARIVTWEQAGNPIGKRIARALGFADTGRRHGTVEVWQWSGINGSGDRRGDQRPLLVFAGAERTQGAEEGRAARGSG